jgi:hypothetical protein
MEHFIAGLDLAGEEGLLDSFYRKTLSLIYLAWNPQRR